MICSGKALTDACQFEKYWSKPKNNCLKKNKNLFEKGFQKLFTILCPHKPEPSA